MILLSSQLLEDQANGFNPMGEVGDVKLFVGGVEVVVGKAETHHYAGNLQTLVEIVDDGNRSAAPDEDGFLIECIAQRLGGGFDVGVVSSDNAGRPLAEHVDLGLNAFGRQL